jgi:hypothetical protein
VIALMHATPAAAYAGPGGGSAAAWQPVNGTKAAPRLGRAAGCIKNSMRTWPAGLK